MGAPTRSAPISALEILFVPTFPHRIDEFGPARRQPSSFSAHFTTQLTHSYQMLAFRHLIVIRCGFR